LYYENTDSGRYVEYAERGINVLDTKTGKLYIYNEDKIILYDLLNATRNTRGIIPTNE